MTAARKTSISEASSHSQLQRASFCYAHPLVFNKTIRPISTTYFGYYCFCRCLSRRSYRDSDAYVALYRDAPSCSCRGSSSADCEACRASWGWHDGTPMHWWNWQDEEPNLSPCGRIANDAWAENSCSEEIRFVCERGMFTK